MAIEPGTVPPAAPPRDVFGYPLALARAGAGPTLLYLHDENGRGPSASFIAALERKFDVMAPEHPGYGQSPMPDWLDEVSDLATFYLHMLRGLGAEPVHLVGASIGGWIALDMALREPGRFKSLSLIASAGVHVPGVRKGDIFLWSAEAQLRNSVADRKIADGLIAGLAVPGAMALRIKDRVATARLAWQPRLHDPRLRKWLGTLAVPTTIVWGAEDRVLPVEYARHLAGLIPGAAATILEDCGHLPHVERPEATIAAIEALVAGAAA